MYSHFAIVFFFSVYLLLLCVMARTADGCQEGARTSASLAATPFCRASCGVCHWQQPDDGQNFLSRVRVVKSHGPVILFVYAMLASRVPQASNSAELLASFQ